jgi:hypothetical protein
LFVDGGVPYPIEHAQQDIDKPRILQRQLSFRGVRRDPP